MSYITAIMQVTARSENLPLDGMILKTDILNVKDWNDLESRAEKGAFIHGFFLEGAGWEMGRGTEQGYLTDMILKDLHPLLPVMHVTSIEKTKHTKVGMYRSPAYMTTMRGPTYVFECFIRMESEETDDLLWVLAGVALLMAPE
jgi:dynein heavy chain